LTNQKNEKRRENTERRSTDPRNVYNIQKHGKAKLGAIRRQVQSKAVKVTANNAEEPRCYAAGVIAEGSNYPITHEFALYFL
jgi:hypothetical protein